MVDSNVWILIVGEMDPGINSLDKLCGNAFSLKGVQCKQWDPDISYFGETLQDGLMEQVNLFSQWIDAPVLLHDEQICITLECFCLRTSRFGRGGLSCPHIFGTLKVLTVIKFLGSQIEINYYS